MKIRPFKETDLSAVLAIEESVHLIPWTRETFLNCFEAGYLAWVVECDGRVVGFLVASFQVDECHILNVCILRTHQRGGLGFALMKEALHKAQTLGVGVVYLEVRRSNTKAIALYRKMAFTEVGERKGYYPDANGGEDALIFAKSLINDTFGAI